MTISTLVNRNDYAGTGITGPYAYNFRIIAAAHLAVTITVAGVTTALSYPLDYSVSGVGNRSGGSITLTLALPVGGTLTIQRDVPLTQETDLKNQGSYYPETHEAAFDKTLMIDQQLQEQLDRSLHVSSALATINTELPFPTAGQAIVGTGTGFTMATLSTNATALPGQSRTVTTLSGYLANNAVFNVKDYGAIGNGIINDTTALRLALSSCIAAGGGVVYLPPGSYLVTSVAGTPVLALGNNVTLMGAGPDVTTILWGGGALVGGALPINLVQNASLGGGNTRIQVIGLTLDFAQAGRVVDSGGLVGNNGLNFRNVSDFLIRDVEVTRAAQTGILIAAGCSRGLFENLDCHNNHEQGFAISPTNAGGGGAVGGTLPSYMVARNVNAYDNALVSLVGDQAIFSCTKSQWFGGFAGGRTARVSNSAFVVGSDFDQYYTDVKVVGLICAKSTTGINMQRCPDSSLIDVTVDDVTSDGIIWSVQLAKQPTGCSTVNARLKTIGGSGIRLIGTGGHRILGGHATGVTGHGVWLDLFANAGSQIIGFKADGCAGDGVRNESSTLVLIGCTLINSSAGFGYHEVNTGGVPNSNILDATNNLAGNASGGTGILGAQTVYRRTIPGVSGDRGDTSVTLVMGTDRETQWFASNLTAPRTVTLPSAGIVNGSRYKVVRLGVGAGTLDVGGLKTIPAATAGVVEVEHDGIAWRLTGYHLL